MDYIKATQENNNVRVSGVKNFCLDDILDCGQCFRWEKLTPGHWRGIVRGLCRTVRQEDSELVFENTSLAEFDSVWYDYFDFGRDYSEVKQILSQDSTMLRAIEFTPGMRVLRQEPWEALCSFILSQNNNIKRIRGLVSRLCEGFGEKVEGGYAFPAAEKLAGLEAEDLAPVRSGFRAGYVIAAAKAVENGLDLESLREIPLSEARLNLMRIRGVGPKVAACALLYGLGRADSVPVDVWIDRALSEYYPNGIPDGIADVAGLGQQYLFHFMRNNKLILK